MIKYFSYVREGFVNIRNHLQKVPIYVQESLTNNLIRHSSLMAQRDDLVVYMKIYSMLALGSNRGRKLWLERTLRLPYSMAGIYSNLRLYHCVDIIGLY